MTEEPEPPFSLLCSGCRTPCSGPDAHVVPRWRPDQRRILTSYRCSNCWIPALAELRVALTSGDAEVPASFCDFLARHGYEADADQIRAASAEQQRTWLLAVVDAVESGQLTFHP
jgi:hypothetical protein